MGDVTHEQANLMLKLFDMRREPRLRQARAWYVENFFPQSVQDVMTLAPPGSEANANMRMVLTYWDMCANIVNRGLIDEQFFFETSGEQFVAWERIQQVVAQFRATFKNPLFLEQLEVHCKRLEAWREKRAPGSVAAMREFMKQQAQQAKAAAKAAS